ncbi:uncharacterized protein B0T23DRAFT_25472 [Neurospora hispaniola]|uniref:Uncharacterized protein n=1 Tax=Neurospora hispaniola TaxID=588809 RepID=A0AAJ0MVJ0_9PEZI|nr:hypothetical protein B0T23DRAFT_25472 [Neurospora hispaniola]
MLRSGRRTLASRLLSAPCPKEDTEQLVSKCKCSAVDRVNGRLTRPCPFRYSCSMPRTKLVLQLPYLSQTCCGDLTDSFLVLLLILALLLSLSLFYLLVLLHISLLVGFVALLDLSTSWRVLVIYISQSRAPVLPFSFNCSYVGIS